MSIIGIFVLFRTIRCFVKELMIDVHDRFKLTQLAFTILYLVARIAFNILLPIVTNFEFYGVLAMSISVFFFYYFEIINNLCWITFIIHINACKPDEMNEEVIKRIKKKEKILLAICSLFIIISALVIISLFIIAFLHK